MEGGNYLNAIVHSHMKDSALGAYCFYNQFPQTSDFNAGDPSSMPEMGRSAGEGKGYPLQYSGLENSVDCIVHGVTESQT